jgi:hypothetical protein
MIRLRVRKSAVDVNSSDERLADADVALRLASMALKQIAYQSQYGIDDLNTLISATGEAMSLLKLWF